MSLDLELVSSQIDYRSELCVPVPLSIEALDLRNHKALVFYGDFDIHNPQAQNRSLIPDVVDFQNDPPPSIYPKDQLPPSYLAQTLTYHQQGLPRLIASHLANPASLFHDVLPARELPQSAVVIGLAGEPNQGKTQLAYVLSQLGLPVIGFDAFSSADISVALNSTDYHQLETTPAEIIGIIEQYRDKRPRLKQKALTLDRQPRLSLSRNLDLLFQQFFYLKSSTSPSVVFVDLPGTQPVATDIFSLLPQLGLACYTLPPGWRNLDVTALASEYFKFYQAMVAGSDHPVLSIIASEKQKEHQFRQLLQSRLS
jgi:hypothetical protein